tara:strand:- start:518 stop:766 length:249 start_codon:yes stop_codon:yes gene_type:complete
MSETLYLGTDEIRASAGKFRTTNRYIRSVAATQTFYVAKGATVSMSLGGPGGTPLYRYSVGGYIVAPAGTISFTATVQGVTL